MKVNRMELRNILSALRPGLAQREFVQQSCHFIFFEDIIATYNDKLCITYPFKSDEQFSVKGEEFFRLIDGMTDETVTITMKEGKLKIRSKSTSATLSTISDEGNTLPPTIRTLQNQMEGWSTLPKDFTEGISLCAFSASPDLTTAVRSCVQIKDNLCSSLDISRASLFEMESPIQDHLFIVAKEATELAKFNVIEYCADDKWGHFRTKDGVTFSCKLLTGTFPENFLSVFESKSDLKHHELPKELKTVIDSVFILAHDMLDKTGREIEVKIEDGDIFVKAENDLGWVEKNLRCTYKGDPIILNINAKFISQILDKAAKFACEGKVIHFSSGSFQHLLSQTAKRETK